MNEVKLLKLCEISLIKLKEVVTFELLSYMRLVVRMYYENPVFQNDFLAYTSSRQMILRVGRN